MFDRTGSALLLALCAACGGGGGTAAPAGPATDARLSVAPVLVPAGQSSAAMVVRLDALPRPAALLQFDLSTDFAQLEVDRSIPLGSLQALPTLDGAMQHDNGTAVYRVECGDGQHRSAQLLHTGPLLQIALRALTATRPLQLPVELRNVKLVDNAGADLPVAGLP